MSTRVWISKIRFSDGSEIEFDPNQITVFVGPNNTGKSATLTELNTFIRTKNREGKVVKDHILEKEGDEKKLLDYIKSLSIEEYSSNPEPRYKGYKYSINSAHLDFLWNRQQNELGDLHSLFVNLLSTEERLKISNPPKNISLTNEPPTHPIHFLQKDDALELKFSEYFSQAFGDELIIHRNAGNQVPLYIGERPKPRDGEDRVSINYLKEIEKLPLLHEQGDGMRSFVGVLLSAFISNHNILFIDEPEAFLHPPQARLLGKMLAKDLPEGRQLFLATHSGDFMRGLLEADVSNLKIVRIERDKDINHISVLNNSEIKDLWSDTLLRHSNILDGLFHTKVIICESDSDCRFYSAMLQSIYENESSISPDLLFIHCGGKHRVNTVVKSLKKLNVEINTVLDFDILNAKLPLKEIFEELGGDWSTLKSDWNLVKQSIDSKRPELETEDLKSELIPLLEATTERIFPTDKIREIKNLLKKTSAWAHAKQVGKNFVPNGDPTQAYHRMIASLNIVGLYVVEVGELESFVKSIGNHGPTWVNDVLQMDLVNDPELEVAREFVRKLV